MPKGETLESILAQSTEMAKKFSSKTWKEASSSPEKISEQLRALSKLWLKVLEQVLELPPPKCFTEKKPGESLDLIADMGVLSNIAKKAIREILKDHATRKSFKKIYYGEASAVDLEDTLAAMKELKKTDSDAALKKSAKAILQSTSGVLAASLRAINDQVTKKEFKDNGITLGD
jgi:hypothetical protein